jgi:hypothetical protein
MLFLFGLRRHLSLTGGGVIGGRAVPKQKQRINIRVQAGRQLIQGANTPAYKCAQGCTKSNRTGLDHAVILGRHHFGATASAHEARYQHNAVIHIAK